jgi:hypothetical protein
MNGSAAAPISSLRRSGDCRPLFVSSDMSTPFLVSRTLIGQARMTRICALHRYVGLRILHRKIAT